MSKYLSEEEFEEIFAQAVIKSFEDELAAIPPREELEKMYTFSDRHKARMEELFEEDKFHIHHCPSGAICTPPFPATR